MPRARRCGVARRVHGDDGRWGGHDQGVSGHGRAHAHDLSSTALSPRAHALLSRVKVLVAIGGPLVIAAGIAMLVLPGPGLVVITLGFALLALDYEWARRMLGLFSRALSRLRAIVFPGRARAVTALIGSQAIT